MSEYFGGIGIGLALIATGMAMIGKADEKLILANVGLAIVFELAALVAKETKKGEKTEPAQEQKEP